MADVISISAAPDISLSMGIQKLSKEVSRCSVNTASKARRPGPRSPDIKKYSLDELRFGDIVLLKDTQTDYGKGYYKGGATVGIICTGPSDLAGMDIGVTPVLSTRFGKLTARLDPTANIGKYLCLRKGKAFSCLNQGVLKTNREMLITTAVQGVVQPPQVRSGMDISHEKR